MGKKSLAQREAELIAAARRELAVGQVRAPAPAPPRPAAPAPSSLQPAPATAPQDAAARVAALLSAEQEARQRRNKKLRQIGLAIPAMVAVGAILWLAVALLRYFRF